jgi:hypothetical protein
VRAHAVPAAALLVALVGCGTTKTVVRTTTAVQQAAPATTGDQWFHVEIRSIARDGDRFLVEVDPSWFLGGIAANVARAHDQHRTCKPAACPPVDNDNYVVDESRRTYTFVLPATTTGTVLTSSDTRHRITAAQLQSIVEGKSTLSCSSPFGPASGSSSTSTP